jgi:hypothetical protein
LQEAQKFIQPPLTLTLTLTLTLSPRWGRGDKRKELLADAIKHEKVSGAGVPARQPVRTGRKACATDLQDFSEWGE